MKLTAQVIQLNVNHRGDWLFVRLSDDAGHTGWGEASHSGDDGRTRQILQRSADDLCARSYTALSPDALPRAAAHADKPTCTACSAVEHAWTDLMCRRAGKSVAQTLAATAGPVSPAQAVPVYANLNRMCADRSAQSVAAAAKSALAAGLTRMKFAPFDEVSPQAIAQAPGNVAALLAPGAERLQAIRDAIGAQGRLMVDCHWRFTKDSLPHLARVIRDTRAEWIEDPLPVLDAGSGQFLRAQTGALIAGGEALLRYDDFRSFVRMQVVDVLIADVKFVGGIGELHRLCQLASDHGMALAPHNPSGPVSTAASAQVAAANANVELLEYPFGEVNWRAALARGEVLDGGKLVVGGPGLGIDLDLSAAPGLAQ